MTKYKTLKEAQAAAKKLNIKTSTEYDKRYKEDPQLVSDPDRRYKTEWLSWGSFLFKVYKYPSWEEASIASINLGILTSREYKEKHALDDRLPISPRKTYKNVWEKNGKMPGFLGQPESLPTKPFSFLKYQTYKEASEAAQKLNCESRRQYIKLYKNDPFLVSCPNRSYKNEWTGWNDFLGSHRFKNYSSWDEASIAARLLRVRNKAEYSLKYKQDPKLPSEPQKAFKTDWENNGSWLGFLGFNFYDTWEVASEVAIALGITSSKDYQKKYKQDERLHSSPETFYSSVWVKNGRWSAFLGKDAILPKYENILDASRAAIALGIKTFTEYKTRYKEDPRLPAAPSGFYSNWEEFGGSNVFFNKNIVENYKSYEEASQAAQRLGILTFGEYSERYKEDERLPSSPQVMFKNDWFSWSLFLGLQLSSMEAKDYITKHNICTLTAYKRHQCISLPECPKAAYLLSSFDEFLNLRVFTLKMVRKFCSDNKIQSSREYDKIASTQAHLPITLNLRGYKTHTQIITKSPFDFVPEKYHVWRDFADDFCSKGTGLKFKQQIIISFLKGYIIEKQQPANPIDFFKDNHKAPKIDGWLESLAKSSKNKTAVKYINEFTTEVFNTLCCLTCDTTGEITNLQGFRNHFINRNVEIINEKNKLSETDKPPLPLLYVNAVADWIAPSTANSFKELTDIQKLFSMDWYEVDRNKIDINDEDCVYRKTDSGYEMWSPVRAMANLILFKMPLRGQQILWLDSGEADTLAPKFIDGKVSWVENTNALKDSIHAKGEQGFLRSYQGKDEILTGAYITTNKTGLKDGGFEIDWIPDELIPWIIRLREWQEKYNPLSKVYSWAEIKMPDGVKVDQKILKKRGCQCFLFRDPYGKTKLEKASPMYTSRAFGSVLPGLLAQIQTEECPLAQIIDPTKSMSVFNYTSEFTPHSLRVSHITALVLDYELPIPVVAKLVGHAQIVMTIYYVKITNYDIRKEMKERESEALKKGSERIQALLMEREYEQASKELLSIDKDILNQLVNSKWPTAALIFKDFGICPYSSSKCLKGGKDSKPVKIGYLGQSNCFQCRYLITGPAFLGGLKAMADDISLELNVISKKMTEYLDLSNNLEDERYDNEQAGEIFLKERELAKTLDEYNLEAENFSNYTGDLIAIYRLMAQSAELLNSKKSDSKGYQLIVSEECDEIGILLEEVSEFRHLSEICKNAEFYSCVKTSRALPTRSQLIDKMAQNNGLQPGMFALNDKQQLAIGNQITEILLSRLGNWNAVDNLIEGQITLNDLGIENTFKFKEIKLDISNLLTGEDNNNLPDSSHNLKRVVINE